jgi:hypothetical protein
MFDRNLKPLEVVVEREVVEQKNELDVDEVDIAAVDEGWVESVEAPTATGVDTLLPLLTCRHVSFRFARKEITHIFHYILDATERVIVEHWLWNLLVLTPEFKGISSLYISDTFT